MKHSQSPGNSQVSVGNEDCNKAYFMEQWELSKEINGGKVNEGLLWVFGDTAISVTPVPSCKPLGSALSYAIISCPQNWHL